MGILDLKLVHALELAESIKKEKKALEEATLKIQNIARRNISIEIVSKKREDAVAQKAIQERERLVQAQKQKEEKQNTESRDKEESATEEGDIGTKSKDIDSEYPVHSVQVDVSMVVKDVIRQVVDSLDEILAEKTENEEIIVEEEEEKEEMEEDPEEALIYPSKFTRPLHAGIPPIELSVGYKVSLHLPGDTAE